ncbi:MAG: hypothetical protein LBR10_05195 [Prevotellaceae bacterium]|nr:hypothetical protein [Prevotellaceae bacterium]
MKLPPSTFHLPEDVNSSNCITSSLETEAMEGSLQQHQPLHARCYNHHISIAMLPATLKFESNIFVLTAPVIDCTTS